MTDETIPEAPDAPAPEVPVVQEVPVPLPELVTEAVAEVRRRRVDEEGGVHQGRTDEDVRIGQFASVVDGPLTGRYVVYLQTLTSGKDGYPELVLCRSRDDRDELLQVEYAHLRPAQSGGR